MADKMTKSSMVCYAYTLACNWQWQLVNILSPALSDSIDLQILP